MLRDFITYEDNDNSHNLKIFIEPRHRKKQIWNRDNNTSSELSENKTFSWFLNGYLSHGLADIKTKSGDFDTALSYKTFVFEGRWNTDFDQTLNSLYYRVVKDISDIPMRVIVGDVRYQAVGQQRNKQTSGLSIESNFNLQPYKRFFPQGERDFFLQNSGWVNIYLNDRLYSRKYLLAGNHRVNELPILVGQNTIKIIIEEDNGRKEEITFLETGSLSVFNKDVHLFSYTIGSSDLALSEQYKSQEESSGLFSFYHFYGLSDFMTLGAYGQLSSDEKLFAGAMNWRSNIFNGSITYARAETEQVSRGSYYELNLGQTYWLNSKRVGYNFLTSFSQQGYKRLLELPADKDQFLVDLALNIELGSGWFSSFGGRWESYNQFQEDETYIGYIQLSKNNQNWGGRLRLEQSSQNDFSFELSLNYYWGGSRTFVSQYQYDSLDEVHQFRNTYNSPFRNRGFQIDTQISKSPNFQSEQADIDYTHERFLASIDMTRSKLDDSQANYYGNVKFASAISYVDGAWGMSRPITDAFAIVTNNESDKTILVNPSNNGKSFTSKANHLNGVLTQLNSYSQQSVKLEAQENETLRFEENQFTVVPTYKTGYLLKAEVKGDRVLKGKLLHEGKIVPLSVFTLVSEDGETSEVSFTDEEGRFWFDGMNPGKYYIDWYEWKSEQFTVKGGDIFIDIGDIKLNRLNK